MRKNNKHPTQTKNEVILIQDNSDNIYETEKYLKKLELQHSILNRLIGSDLKRTSENKDIEQNWSKPEDPSKTKQ